MFVIVVGQCTKLMIEDIVDYLLFLFYIIAGCVAVFFLAIIIKEYSYFLSVDIDMGDP